MGWFGFRFNIGASLRVPATPATKRFFPITWLSFCLRQCRWPAICYWNQQPAAIWFAGDWCSISTGLLNHGFHADWFFCNFYGAAQAYTLLQIRLLRFFIAGLFGVFLLSFGRLQPITHYPKTSIRFGLSPRILLYAGSCLKNKSPYGLNYYFLATYVLMMVLLLGWKHNPQPANIAFAPLIILLAARSITIFTDRAKTLATMISENTHHH